MANFLSVDVDVQNCVEALAGTSKSMTSIKKQALGIIAKGAVKQIKAIISTTTEKHTGELLNAYRYKVRKDGSETNVYPKGAEKGNAIFPKVMTLSYGHSGPTQRAKNWHIKALGFVQSGDAYVESGAYMPELEKMIDKQLKKYWGN